MLVYVIGTGIVIGVALYVVVAVTLELAVGLWILFPLGVGFLIQVIGLWMNRPSRKFPKDPLDYHDKYTQMRK